MPPEKLRSRATQWSNMIIWSLFSGLLYQVLAQGLSIVVQCSQIFSDVFNCASTGGNVPHPTNSRSCCQVKRWMATWSLELTSLEQRCSVTVVLGFHICKLVGLTSLASINCTFFMHAASAKHARKTGSCSKMIKLAKNAPESSQHALWVIPV